MTHVLYSHVMQIHANFCVLQVNTYGVKVRSFIPTHVGLVISEILFGLKMFSIDFTSKVTDTKLFLFDHNLELHSGVEVGGCEINFIKQKLLK